MQNTADRDGFFVTLNIPEAIRHFESLDDTPHGDVVRRAINEQVRKAGWRNYTEHHVRTDDTLTVTVKCTEVSE